MPENNQENIKMPTINTITGLRGIAALWVVVYHIWVGMGEQNITSYGIDITPFFIGEFGVDIFFVLSGFAVFLPCAYAIKHNLKISWKSFYLRRTARLFPAYHLQLFIISLIFSSGLYASDISFLDAIKHIFLLQNIPPSNSTQILGVYWTLPVEMNFYLSIPILFFMIKRLGIVFTLFFCVFTCGIYRYFIFHIYGNNELLWLQINQLFGRLDEFAIGIAASMFFVLSDKAGIFYTSQKNKDWLWLSIGIIGIISCIYYFELSGGKQYYYEGHFSLFLFDTILAISIGILIIALTLEGKMGTALFANPLMIFLGTISYGIYLWHSLIFTLLIDHFPIMTQINFLQEAMLGIGVIIAVASLSYFLVEKPIMNFAKIHLSKNY